MAKRMTRRERRHCPHVNLIGIYGDSVWQVPGFRRLRCGACGQVLDGPVALAEIRNREHRAFWAERAGISEPDDSRSER